MQYRQNNNIYGQSPNNNKYQQNNIYGESQFNNQNKLNYTYVRFVDKYPDITNERQLNQRVKLFCQQENCSRQMSEKLLQKVKQEYFNHFNFLTPNSISSIKQGQGQGQKQEQSKEQFDFTGVDTPTGLNIMGDTETQSVQEYNQAIQNELNGMQNGMQNGF